MLSVIPAFSVRYFPCAGYVSVYAVPVGFPEKALEEKQWMEQMPKGSIHKRLAWGVKKSEMENQQRKKNKTKNRGMER